jgi:5'-nucleotidase
LKSALVDVYYSRIGNRNLIISQQPYILFVHNWYFTSKHMKTLFFSFRTLAAMLWLCCLCHCAFAQATVLQARQTPLGQTITFEGTVSRGWGKSLYVQDALAGIEVQQVNGIMGQILSSNQIASGDRVRITGIRQERNNQQIVLLADGEFTSQSRIDVLERSGRSPKPIVLTYAELMANPAFYESRCVLLKDLRASTSGSFVSGMQYTVTAQGIPSQTLTLSVPQERSNLGDQPALAIPAGNFVFEGVVIRSGNQYQLSATLKRDIYEPYRLTILHNNDGESNLIEAGSTPTLKEFGGVSRFKTLLDRLKASAISAGNGVLTVSSGDNFLAGAIFNANLQLPPNEPFYDTKAMETFGYDAICIGNHDLDFGPDILARFISGFRGMNNVFLSANLDYTNEPDLLRLQQEGWIAPRRVVTINGERVGVIGLTTPLLRSISTPRNIIIEQDVTAVVQREVDRLQEAGVNKIILISHMQTLDADYELGRSIRGVDVVIAGGSDATLTNNPEYLVPGDVVQGTYPLYITDLDGIDVPNVTTGGDYKYIGNLVVWFNPVGELVWVDPLGSRPYRVASTTYPDGVVRNRELVAKVDEPILKYLNALASRVVAVAEDSLDGRRPPIRIQETNLGNLFADALLWQARQLAPSFGIDRVDIALQNGGGIRNNSLYPAGHQLTELNTFDIAAFSNFVGVAQQLTPLEVRRLVEHGIARLPLEGGQYCQIAGMRVEIDLSEPSIQYNSNTGQLVREGSRVRNLILDDGTYVVYNGVVQPVRNLNVATIDFLARNSGNNLGGDNYPFRSESFVPMGRTYQQALFNFLTVGLGGVISKRDYPNQINGWFRMVRVTKAQIIHNAPDPNLETVDVFINNRLVLDNFTFRTATPYVYVPSDQPATISFSASYQANDPASAALSLPYEFQSQVVYQAIATGVLNSLGFKPNPNGIATDFTLNVTSGVPLSSRDATLADVSLFHGSPDGPTLSVRGRDANRFELTGFAYTNRQGPLGLVDAPTLIDLVLPDGSLFGTWSLTPLPYVGESSLVVASGFVDTENNPNGKPFGLYAIRPNGEMYPLIRLGTQKSQLAPAPNHPATVYFSTNELVINFHQAGPDDEWNFELYDMAGQRVLSLKVSGRDDEQIHLDASRVPNGVYIYHMSSSSNAHVNGKLILSR